MRGAEHLPGKLKRQTQGSVIIGAEYGESRATPE